MDWSSMYSIPAVSPGQIKNGKKGPIRDAALRSSRQPNTIQVQIKTGDGDTSIRVTVTLNQLFTTPQKAVAASIFDPAAICQAFSDSAAIKPLGAPFNAANDTIFVNDGGVGSVASDNIIAGAFLCSSSSFKLLANEAKTTISTSISSATSSSASASKSKATVTIELGQSADESVQGTVPADGSVFLTAGTNFGALGLDFHIVAAQGTNVNKFKCQAFYDTAATVAAGTFATGANDRIFSRVTGASW